MPPTRTKSSAPAKASAGPAKKLKKTVTKPKAAPKLQKSTAPNWKTEASGSLWRGFHPEWSEKIPKSQNAKLCIERWCLLPPYDHQITDSQWKAYYKERSELDKVNTCGSKSARFVESEDLCCSTWGTLELASSKVSAAIYGSVLDENEKITIARTLRGSLYFTGLDGQDDDGPRTVSAKTRLYSPFGLGTSVDFAYDYHFRYREGEQFGSLIAMSNTVDSADAENPRKCKAIKGFDRPQPGSVEIFAWHGSRKVKATTSSRITSFEPTLFGSTGWISPLKMHNLLWAAGTGLLYREDNYTVDPEVASREKFQYFQSETTGEELSKAETELYNELNDEEPGEDVGEDVYIEEYEKPGCVPKRLLLLARQE